MINLPVNKDLPRIMHVDLNSAFATTEQQAHPSLRGKPIGVTNRISKYCCVIAASYEAKDLGVKVGMRLDEAKLKAPNLIMLESDPPKYHWVYQRLARIMKDYSPNVTMKSIDEGIIDFNGYNGRLSRRKLINIGYEIKQRVREDIGSWMKINVGIGTNRFLAKTASSLHKPDGLDIIDHENLIKIYSSLKLTDLTGIASHFEARLNSVGIFTPLDFLESSSDTLKRLVFKSVCGDDWYARLRGYEVDDRKTKLGNIGRQYVLDTRTTDDSILLPRFQYLCETTGKKLRYNNLDARGILVWANFQTGDRWYQRKMFKTSFFTDNALYQRALFLFNQRPRHLVISAMGVTCHQLTPTNRHQFSIFENINREEYLITAMDKINERYGNFVISSANSLEGKKQSNKKYLLVEQNILSSCSTESNLRQAVQL